MQILNTSNQTFEGTFRIKPNEIKAKTEIPQLFTQGRQIFHDILEKGDEVIVLRNQYDKRVGKYIQEKNISGIEYYPEINTSSGLDDQQPEGILKLLKNKTVKVITDITEICTTSAAQRRLPKFPKAKKEVEKIANTLRLNIEKPQINSTAALTKVRDEEKKRTIEIIMPNKGTTYVYVKPDCLYEGSTKCIIDGQGNIMKKFETPDEIHKFIKRFQDLKKQQVNLLVDNF